MLPEPMSFVIQPTRIANVVHYLTHGRTLNTIILNQDVLEALLAKLKKQAGQQPSWKSTRGNNFKTKISKSISEAYESQEVIKASKAIETLSLQELNKALLSKMKRGKISYDS